MIDELRQLALRLAPELGSQPLYVFAAPPALPRVSAHCMGFTVFGQSALIREHLRSLGEWQGPGTTICLFSDGLSPADKLAVFLHELGHAVPVRTPAPDHHSTLEELVSEYRWFAAERPPAPATRMPWEPDHGIDFIRRELHLQYRVGLLGVDVPLESLAAGPRYGLSMPENYRWELSSEPQRFARKTFAEIDAESMPRRFVELFARDAATYV